MGKLVSYTLKALTFYLEGKVCQFQKRSVLLRVSLALTLSASRADARFSKVPKPFGRILGGIILFVSSKRRRLEARNFAIILTCISFTTYEKTSFMHRIGGADFYEWLLRPEKFSELSRHKPQGLFTCQEQLVRFSEMSSCVCEPGNPASQFWW